MQEKTIINDKIGLTEISEVLSDKTARLGKKPKEFRFQFESNKITLWYDYNRNLGIQSIVKSTNGNTQIELKTSSFWLNKKTVIIVSVSVFATISIIWLNKGIEISKEIMWGVPIGLLIIYFQLKATLKGMHETSLRLLKRSIALANENKIIP